jgi:diamine N-acetyltransferase
MTLMAEISFRRAEDRDALCLGVLATQVFLDTYAREGIRPSLAREVHAQFSIDAVSASLADPRAHFIVAEHAGHLVAFAQLTHGAVHELVKGKPATELDRLYVQEPFTARGIGRALLHRCEDLAASLGAATLWLTAWVGNARALSFYARQGYTDLGATPYVFESERHENRVFAKALRGEARA